MSNFNGLDNEKLVQNFYYLRENKIETYDTYFNLFGNPTYEGNFYDVG